MRDAKPWILVVDDKSSMRILIELILMSQGWSAVGAGGADAAIEAPRARPQPPSLVICDVLVPGVDGLNLVRRMRARMSDS